MFRKTSMYLNGCVRFVLTQYRERRITTAMRQMSGYDLSALRRIVCAHLYGTRTIGVGVDTFDLTGGQITTPMGQEIYVLDQHGQPLTDAGGLTWDEYYVSSRRPKATAAFRLLARADFTEEHMLEGPRGFTRPTTNRFATAKLTRHRRSRRGLMLNVGGQRYCTEPSTDIRRAD